ncbi:MULTISPECIES: tRNA (adenosine(37)-N6)-threonylcarbamoyltransferase complex dimerization subunit type 1 TsaB [Micrococcaceae]|uniref:tRNA (adenosine(37)-N6)-threonylcarbamoyltransferase complex dimerization subunit type 1 TsaB n=1 Tax=unclassified Kocuria TaxID=2649579 RepID=UPI001012440D|nr:MULTISPECIES: tRNA (adenosine(37)-N6)-threonylcarbamoyltransferase complex dimerization subunit type 1 TsaB [unclassified Kocuria]
MLILGCDTSSIASGALIEVDDHAAGGEPYVGPLETLGSFRTHDTRSHAEAMAPGIRRLLDTAGVRGQDLGMIVTGLGPGPFTGLRAGITTARTMAWAWAVPVRGAVSLDAIAEGSFRDARSAGFREFRVATDARRREVYSAVYRLSDPGSRFSPEPGYERISGPTVGNATELDPDLPTAGKGVGLYNVALEALTGHEEDEPLAELLVASALRSGLNAALETTSPLYLRESDAKVPAGRKRATR